MEMTYESYSKADFRAIREMLGITQDIAALALGVQAQTVKKWEKERCATLPPEDACKWLTEMWAKHNKIVNSVVAQNEALYKSVNCTPENITLTYYRNAQDYRKYGRDNRGGDTWQMVNARTRAIAQALMAKGYMVKFQYPSDLGNVYIFSERLDWD